LCLSRDFDVCLNFNSRTVGSVWFKHGSSKISKPSVSSFSSGLSGLI
jgi:hypothetical protein